MSFLITKTLLKEFLQCPKYARRHINDKKTYKYIQAELYGSMDMSGIGQEVEDVFMQQYIDYTRINDPFDYMATADAIQRGDAVIYQPAFTLGNLYVRCDVLAKNGTGTYDLIEIKSKNTIRSKSATHTLHEDLVYDISFQKYVLDQVLGSKFSGKVYIVHVNKDYIKDGMIDPDSLLIRDDCSDSLLSSADVFSFIDTLSEIGSLDEKSFDVKYPYAGENPLLYFGKKISKDSIFSIKSRYLIKPLIVDRYRKGKISVHDLDDEDLSDATEYISSGETIALHIRRMQAGVERMDTSSIDTILSGLTFPLCFYDYETVATPIPLFDGYHPWQQAVVQYSIHIVHEDGNVEHKQCIVQGSVDTNKSVVDAFVQDIGSGYGSYIVRNKSFENGRNSELSVLFPDYASIFSMINERTFDLMDIFKNNLYFHPDFQGSASIKKVLPVLTDISYSNLPVGDGGSATDLLQKIIKGTIPASELDSSIENLSRYCTLDTWAMVQIWQKLRGK